MLQTKFGDHPSIISLEIDIETFYFPFPALAAPKRGQSNQYEQTL
jgi:hypothetical protein